MARTIQMDTRKHDARTHIIRTEAVTISLTDKNMEKNGAFCIISIEWL